MNIVFEKFAKIILPQDGFLPGVILTNNILDADVYIAEMGAVFEQSPLATLKCSYYKYAEGWEVGIGTPLEIFKKQSPPPAYTPITSQEELLNQTHFVKVGNVVKAKVVFKTMLGNVIGTVEVNVLLGGYEPDNSILQERRFLNIESGIIKPDTPKYLYFLANEITTGLKVYYRLRGTNGDLKEFFLVQNSLVETGQCYAIKAGTDQFVHLENGVFQVSEFQISVESTAGISITEVMYFVIDDSPNLTETMVIYKNIYGFWQHFCMNASFSESLVIGQELFDDTNGKRYYGKRNISRQYKIKHTIITEGEIPVLIDMISSNEIYINTQNGYTEVLSDISEIEYLQTEELVKEIETSFIDANYINIY